MTNSPALPEAYGNAIDMWCDHGLMTAIGIAADSRAMADEVEAECAAAIGEVSR